MFQKYVSLLVPNSHITLLQKSQRNVQLSEYAYFDTFLIINICYTKTMWIFQDICYHIFKRNMLQIFYTIQFISSLNLTVVISNVYYNIQNVLCNWNVINQIVGIEYLILYKNVFCWGLHCGSMFWQVSLFTWFK